ncbi:glycoside hydrolase family 2 protein [Stappia sp. GBMRC 2046]|uniref:beta-mannosidase n=2 Tax=Stappia sediminis TaxID=2692190 RepID=A0A7X3S992_9HYPH|nr:glycoside hydrolase family 2 protein [Stappia sediminis]MXN66614.1 glycoside hydrolase family 2 protein [Stappia sediminis]
MTVAASGEWQIPADIPAETQWHAARVPGTAARALTDAGLYDPENPDPLHDKDVWYRARITPRTTGRHTIVFEGLATIAEGWLDGEPILISDSMFAAQEVEVELSGDAELCLCFRALEPHLSRKGPRAKWRTQLAKSQGLRLIRTTLLGHMPGWCPEIHAVGPWRPVSMFSAQDTFAEIVEIRSDLLEDGTGKLDISLRLADDPRNVYLACAGQMAEFLRDETGQLRASLEIPDVEPWWPHTHGTSRLYDVVLVLGDELVHLMRTGFRRIEIDRGADGTEFALKINGERIFCRGAVWTNADLLSLPGDRESYRPWLELAREANMNMLRVGGTMVYETRDFFELCDELGILVWHDFQFANFDYPVKDPEFADKVSREAEAFLAATQGSPSFAVACGGSEILQQAAMMGLPPERWSGPLTNEILLEATTRQRPDVAYVENSPSGGAMPFSPNEGVTHYFGVSAYRAPIEDARRADVKFAAECLAFANVPEPVTVETRLPAGIGHSPEWKARVPRDRGVGWDFEDIRDHYVEYLYGEKPLDLRYGDPERYLDLGRAAVAEVMEAVFAEWRREGSRTAGGLIWNYQDLMPGLGWGVVDATGEPKSAWYALKRAFRPLQIALTNEGTNGLDVHLINDTAETRPVTVELACLRDGRIPVVSGSMEIDLGRHCAQKVAATQIIGAFFDTTYAFRFGPPAHDVTVARMSDRETGEELAHAFQFPLGRGKALHANDIAVTLETPSEGEAMLVLSCDCFAQSVHIRDDGFRPSDNWFHLAPGREKRIRLTRRHGIPADRQPSGEVAALGSSRRFTYSAG